MKIQAYDVHQLPQEAIDLMEDVRTLLNFGKYQKPILTSPSLPNWKGRRGEEVTVFGGTTGVTYICTTDGAATWRIEYAFTL